MATQRYPLSLEALFAALEQPLGLVDDEARRAQLRTYLQLLRPNVERTVFELLSRAAEHVNAAQSNVEARLELGVGGGEWVVEPRDPEPLQDNAFGSGDQEKVTIRIPAELKQLVGIAATRSGVSLNTWYIRVLAAALGSVDTEARNKDEPAPRGNKQSGRTLKGIIGR